MPTRPKIHNARPASAKREDRPSAAKRGYDRRWQKFRTWFLINHPLCADCLAEDKVVAATQVDHVIPHRGDMELFWRPGNHQALCTAHHSAKTRRGE